MTLLPKKTTPQEWTDIALPGLEDLPVKAKRQVSKKDEDDAQKVAYRRYRGAKAIACHRCVAENVAGTRSGAPSNGAYIRIQAGVHEYLCFAHHQGVREREDLERPKGESPK